MAESLHSSFMASAASSSLPYLASAIFVLYIAYRWALPKPIPGIPYNKEATHSLFGDVGPMVKHITKTQQLHDWMAAQNVKLNSPIVQLWTRPFGRPCVVITDYREAHDILIRRTREFDRSKFIADVSGGITPESHFSMQTNDKFRKHRKWVQGIMANGFLHDVAAPFIYEAGQDLLQLWEQKARLAKGHPFAAPEDVYCTTMDAVWPIVFGADPKNSNTKAQLRLYTTITDVPLPSDPRAEAVLPKAPHPEVVQSFFNIMHSVEACIKSPVPVLSHWLLRQTPALKRSFKVKNELIRREIDKAVNRAMGKSEADKEIKCAVDDVVRREKLMAEKENRAPEFYTRGMSDEVFHSTIHLHWFLHVF